MAVQASWSVAPGAQVVDVFVQAIPTRSDEVEKPSQVAVGADLPPNEQVNWSTGLMQSPCDSLAPSASFVKSSQLLSRLPRYRQRLTRTIAVPAGASSLQAADMPIAVSGLRSRSVTTRPSRSLPTLDLQLLLIE